MPLLRVKNLFKKFGGLVAVDNVSFDIGKSEKVGLIGPNGAGKTTIIDLICGMIAPDSGIIEFKGRVINRKKSYERVSMGLSRTFQLVECFKSMTVLENLTVPYLSRRSTIREDRTVNQKEELLKIIESVRLSHLKNELAGKLPHGYLKLLDIARALACKPDLLLLDEPFAGLHPAEMERLIDVIERLHKERGISILIVEHLLKPLSRLVDRVIVIDRGKVIASGPFEEVTNNEKVIEAYFGGEVEVA